MIFREVTISNYRSVSSAKIEIKHGCQILLGINESGKSTILAALNLLNPSATVVEEDLRVARHDDEQPQSGFVRFEYIFDYDEVEELYDSVTKKMGLTVEDAENMVFEVNKEKRSLKQFVADRAVALHEVLIPSGKRRNTVWAISDAYKLLGSWQRNVSGEQISFAIKEETRVIPIDGVFSSIKFPLEATSKAKPFDIQQLVRLIAVNIALHWENNRPICLYWKYDEKHILPAEIDLQNFISDPDLCKPLASMFELAGIKRKEIGPTLTISKAGPINRYFSLLRRVSEAATHKIRDVWRDHPSISIQLTPNGSTIVPQITEDAIHLNMASRSEGFKRFISFLLQVSSQVNDDEINRQLIIIDEPEISLHPASARYLLEEIMRVALSNTVFFSTHSIFMVDKNCIDRHLIVKKENELTQIDRAGSAELTDEQVLFAAVGYSIFETLKQKNIVFEGWKDKFLMKIALAALKKGKKSAQPSNLDYGMTHAEGVKDIKHVARFMELAQRDLLIVSDADAPAEEQRKLYLEDKGYGEWATIQELAGDKYKVKTSEDLIQLGVVKRKANLWAISNSLPPVEDSEFDNLPTIEALQNWVKRKYSDQRIYKAKMMGLKDSLFKDLSNEDLTDGASVVAQEIARRMNNLNRT